MSNSLLFLPDLFCFSFILLWYVLKLDTSFGSNLLKLQHMKNNKGFVALLSLALILAALIIVIIVKFYIGHY